jgi:anti-sigma regulatory factor (Ser/Thr protein kinase)
MATEALARISQPADMDHLEALMNFIGGHAQASGLDPQSLYRVDLAAEEVLTNIIKYAYPEGQGLVEVACGVEDQSFVMEFRDQGQPFDPLAAEEPELSEDLHLRAVGGLGIHLVRQVMDQVSYHRQDQTNLLRIAKIIGATDAP